VTVPEGNLWVMGDNRILSKDSRKLCNNTTTFIPEGKVVGRAFVQIWPPGGISLL
jgi:signal peptidase I